MNQFKEFLEVFKALGQQKVDYVLIGGVAVILHGMERLTRAIDIIVKMSPENIHKLRKALQMVFEDDAIEEITLPELYKFTNDLGLKRKTKCQSTNIKALKRLNGLYGTSIRTKHISEKWLICGTLPTGFFPFLIQRGYSNSETWKKQTSIGTG